MSPRPCTLVTGRLLAAWGPLETPAWLLLLATLLLPSHGQGLIPVALWITSWSVGTYGLYLGWRLRFDAAVFLDMAEGRLVDGAAFDAALVEMGLGARSARSEAERCRGAIRMLKYRILCLLIQVGAVVFGFWKT